MKMKNLICGTMLALGTIMAGSSSITHAEYITAFEEIKYDKYVVDTDSFFYPDKEDKYHQFNCIVWRYTSANDEKGKPYTFRFKYNDNSWYVAERDKDNKLIWVKVENKSIASDVLRVTLPYLGKTNIVKHN